MNDFNFDDNVEIGTSVSKLKKKRMSSNNNDLFSLIKDLEDRLDTIETTNTINPFQESIPKKNKKTKPNEEPKLKYTELIIYMIIFILLNDKFTVGLFYKLPNFKSSPYPNLIVRTLLFGIIVYLYKRYVK
jgi:hypothetical protein